MSCEGCAAPSADTGYKEGLGVCEVGWGHFTLHEVRVVGLVGRQHGGHLVVIGRVDVLINAVAGQLYL